MKKTKFFTCIAALGLILSLGACEGDVNINVGDVNLGDSSSELEEPEESTPSSEPGSGDETTPDTGSGEHTHSYEVTSHKDATCTEAGYDVYTCSCGDTYTQTIAALGHDYQEVVTDPTCTDKGYTTHTCTRCGDEYTDNETAAKGHTPTGDYVSDSSGHWKVCAECGAKVGFEEHSASTGYQYDGTYHWQVCSVCGYEIGKTEHTAADGYISDGNSHWQVCSDCGYKMNETAHSASSEYQSDGTYHWQVCSICNEILNKSEHTPAEGYQSDETYHWQVCSVCNAVLNKATHTEGTLETLDESTHGTKCEVCDKVLSSESHNFVSSYDKEADKWYQVCSDCDYQGSEIILSSKYALYGDFVDSSWNASPSDSNLVLKYNSNYPETMVWTRTVQITAYAEQTWRASFAVVEYGTYNIVANYYNLDDTSTGVLGNHGDANAQIEVHWGGTYDITIDCSKDTPTIHLDWHEDGYSEPEVTAYAIVGDFSDSSWNESPDADSIYYIPLDETVAYRTITLASGLSWTPNFYVVEYGTWNHVLDRTNLTSDSESTLTWESSNGIGGVGGQTYDLVLDFANNTIKVTIHEEELAPVTDEESLKAALEVGGDIKLENDISINATLYLYESAVIDMDGHTITPTKDIYIGGTTNDWSILCISGDIDVTIKGNGTFASRANDTYAIDVRNGANVTIEDGTYVGNIDAIYIEEGFVTIYGGHFSIIQTYGTTTPYKWLLNCKDDSNKAGTACFYLYGGEYENFDPSVATGTTGEDGVTLYEAVVMDGYTVVSSELSGGGTLYSVVEAPEETHTFVADLSSLPDSVFGEENTNGNINPKTTWTRGNFYYWADLEGWVGPYYAWVTVNNASYSQELGGYNFAWTTNTAYGSAEPYAFQIFYTLPEDAGLTVGTTYSITISFVTDYEGYVTINGTSIYVTAGENTTVTLSGLTASNLSDLSIQAGDNLNAGGENFFPLTGSFTITYLAFDF